MLKESLASAAKWREEFPFSTVFVFIFSFHFPSKGVFASQSSSSILPGFVLELLGAQPFTLA